MVCTLCVLTIPLIGACGGGEACILTSTNNSTGTDPAWPSSHALFVLDEVHE